MRLLLASVLLAIAAPAVAAGPKGFALYTVRGAAATEIRKIDLRRFRAAGRPLLDESDLVYYERTEHRLELTYDGASKIRRLAVDRGGLCFVVVADGVPIYKGAFFDGYGDPEFRGVAVDVSRVPVLLFELDYPPLAPKNPGFDPRPDERVFGALRRTGKLFSKAVVSVRLKNARTSGKRRASVVFALEVVGVRTGSFAPRDFELELYSDERGLELADAFGVRPSAGASECGRPVLLKLAISEEGGGFFLMDFSPDENEPQEPRCRAPVEIVPDR